MSADESKQLDSAILTQWHEHYSSRLFAFSLGILKKRALAEEVVQATFTKAFTHGGTVAAGSERAWLFQVAYNESITRIRKLRAQERSVLQTAGNFPSTYGGDETGPVQDLLKNEEQAAVQAAVSELPEAQRQIVFKRIYEEMTFQAIADELQLPLGTVLTRMRSALQRLRQALRANENDDESY